MRIPFLLLVVAVALVLPACAPSEPPAAPPAGEASDAAFLDTVQARTFAWFWETTNPDNGLVPDRAPSRPFSSVAAVGFGLTAYGVGAERGYVTREEAADRTLTTLEFFWNAPMGEAATGMTGHRGFYYHFLDIETGERYQTTELSSIDTALLMMGVLFSQQYFNGEDTTERRIRSLADSLYRRVEWSLFNRDAPLITMGWHPERGYIDAQYKGMDEALFLYILGLGSPTFPVDEEAWRAYTDTYVWDEFYGYEYVQFTPLFGYQYAHVWIDPRALQDAYMRERGIDYFENARRATLAQRNYAIDNPRGFEDYGETIWGLTACDGPANEERVVNGDTIRFHTYWARGASARGIRDDGTIAPTAAGGSIVFAPEEVTAALRAMRERYGDLVFNEHGFVDAFNPTYDFEDGEPQRGPVDPEHGWFDTDHLGIDQGPILLMIENYRSGFIWDVMKDNPYIQQGLQRAGFTADWLTE